MKRLLLALTLTVATSAHAQMSTLTCQEWVYSSPEADHSSGSPTPRLKLPEMNYLIDRLGFERAIAVAMSIDKACEMYPWMLWAHAARLVLQGHQ